MTVPTLILTPRYSEDAHALWRAARRLGWQVVRLSTWHIPAHLLTVAEPVVYLEALFGPMLGEQLGLQLAQPALDWLVHLPERYRKREVQLATLSEARALLRPAFIQPSNEKSFPAGTYSGAQLPRDYAGSMPVLIADAVAWESEYRCFVLDRVLRTFSLYARGGASQQAQEFRCSPSEALALQSFVAELLGDPDVELARAAVLDVGILLGRGWACIAQKPAWGADLYGCDPEEVLQVMRYSSAAPDRLASIERHGSYCGATLTTLKPGV